METADSAWRKMVVMLFKPFNFAKWLTLGFCVWIAQLGEGGGSGNFDFSSFKNDHAGKNANDAFLNALNQIFNGDSGNFFTRVAEQCHISVNILAWICVGVTLFFIIMNHLVLQSEIIQVNNFPSKEAFFNKFGKQEVYDNVDFMMREGIIKDRNFLVNKEMCLFPLNVIPFKHIVVYFDKQSGKVCCVSWVNM